MLYKLLGLLTWKALKVYVSSKVPKKAVVAALFVFTFGLAVAIVTAARRDGEENQALGVQPGRP